LNFSSERPDSGRRWRLGFPKKFGGGQSCSFDEHRNESQAECGSGETRGRLSTGSYTGQGENKTLTFFFWCSAQCSFLIGSNTFYVHWAVRRGTPCWCGRLLSFPQPDASGNSPARVRLDEKRQAGDDVAEKEHA
jgi:hypothetical protein